MLALSTQRETIDALRQQLHFWEVARRPTLPPFSSGCEALDRLLPGRAFQRGTLTEFLADTGIAATALGLIAARQACLDGATLVVVDRGWSFYPPAANTFGIDLGSTIFIRPRTRKDELWALHQSLSCKGVGAVLCWPDKLDGRAFRALQLAAESSGSVGVFIRSLCVRGHPTWSDMQLLVEARPALNTTRRLRIEVVRCRNGHAGATVELELDDETGTLQESRTVSLAPSMAIAAIAPSTARA
ncbi:MAG TPA: hypothetical protein VFE46_05550 [Pirellulales bacterium]|jgi:hypothetical protein|nr:hypothetical protein [Pirellulales bacterium]